MNKAIFSELESQISATVSAYVVAYVFVVFVWVRVRAIHLCLEQGVGGVGVGVGELSDGVAVLAALPHQRRLALAARLQLPVLLCQQATCHLVHRHLWYHLLVNR